MTFFWYLLTFMAGSWCGMLVMAACIAARSDDDPGESDGAVFAAQGQDRQKPDWQGKDRRGM